MKNIIAIIAAFFAVIVWSQAQTSAQEATRQYLLSKLVFYYVNDPTQPKPADLTTIEVDKVTISNNSDITGPLWTNANNAGLKNLLIQILRRPNQGGDYRLQTKIRNVLLISDKKVYVYLYGDFSNGAKDGSWPVYCTTTGYEAAHNNASWPCANYFGDRTLDATGHIGIGAYFFSASRTSGGWETAGDKGTVFIHELTHTQLPLSPINYGNGGHGLREMLPSRNTAFDEGLANAFGYRFHLPATLSMTDWFNNNNALYVDNIGGCSGTPAPATCLQARLTAASITANGTCGWTNAACYNSRDVPAEIIMHNENVIGNLLFQYMQQFNNGDLMLVRDLKRATADMTTASYKFSPLFKEMVKSSMNFRHPRAASGSVTHGQNLPLGILDYYVGYKLDSKATLERVIGATWAATDTNIEDYFSLSNKRNVLLGFRSNATDWNVTRQISRFSEHLNVRPTGVATVGDGND